MKLHRNILLLGMVSLFTDLSSQMIYPLLPKFLLQLGATATIIGIIEGVAEATASLFKTVSGRLSDRVKKRKIFIFLGYGLSTFSKPFLYFAGSWLEVLAVKFSERMGKAIRVPPRDALISTSVDPATKGMSFGFHRAMDRIGCIGGPLLALGVLALYPDNLRLVFLLSVIPGMIALIFIPFVLEQQAQQATSQGQQPLKKKLGKPFLFFIVANTLFTLGNSSNAFLLLKADENGISLMMIPVLWMVYNAVCAVSAPIFGSLSDRVGRPPVIITAFLYYTLIYVLFAFAKGSLAIWVLFAAYGIYYGLSNGVFKAYIADVTPADQRGTAYGLFSTATGLALFPASLMMGYLWDSFGSQSAFIVSAGFSLLGLAVFLLSRYYFSQVSLKSGQP